MYVLQSSGISRKSGTLIVRYSQKKECISFVLGIFQLLLLWNHWSDSSGVFSNMYLSYWEFQSNRKLKMSHVRLPTDFPRSHHIYSNLFTVLRLLCFKSAVKPPRIHWRVGYVKESSTSTILKSICKGKTQDIVIFMKDISQCLLLESKFFKLVIMIMHVT